MRRVPGVRMTLLAVVILTGLIGCGGGGGGVHGTKVPPGHDLAVKACGEWHEANVAYKKANPNHQPGSVADTGDFFLWANRAMADAQASAQANVSFQNIATDMKTYIDSDQTVEQALATGEAVSQSALSAASTLASASQAVVQDCLAVGVSTNA